VTLVSVSTGFGGSAGVAAAVLVEATVAVEVAVAVEATMAVEAAVLVEAEVAALAASDGLPAGASAFETGGFDPNAEAVLLVLAIELAVAGLAAAVVGAGAETGCATGTDAVAGFAFASAVLVGVAAACVGKTVADSTFAVMFGDPAELVVDAVEAALAALSGAGAGVGCFGASAGDAANGVGLVLPDAEFDAAVEPDFACAGWAVLTVREDVGALLAGKVELLFVVTTMVDDAGDISAVAGCVF